MDNLLLESPKESIIFQNERIYICLASYPITHGHTIIIWRSKVEDLHLLNRKDYEYLMDAVDTTRNILMEHFNVEKVYLMYLDEAKQVHWHLVPRYDDKGYNILKENPELLIDFNDAINLRGKFINQDFI